ncbi:hypothetical protein RB195_005196 [Necator americanus]|uniref:Uncharacterized protein n=1 Tax=Necator americanus TaxID=51031 RepID=A0ABR1BLN7_NECAM
MTSACSPSPTKCNLLLCTLHKCGPKIKHRKKGANQCVNKQATSEQASKSESEPSLLNDPFSLQVFVVAKATHKFT